MQNLTILGSTGSIGVNTLDVVARHPQRFRIVALTAKSRTDVLLQQCKQFTPQFAVLTDAEAAKSFEQSVKEAGLSTRVLCGVEALEKVPAALKETEFTDAFGVLARSNWSNKELLEYDQYLDIWRSETGRIEIALAKGLAEGLAEGEQRKAIEIAQQLLDILDITTIAQKTGLSIEKIEALKK